MVGQQTRRRTAVSGRPATQRVAPTSSTTTGSGHGADWVTNQPNLHAVGVSRLQTADTDTCRGAPVLTACGRALTEELWTAELPTRPPMRLPVTPALHGSRHLTRCGHPGQRGGWRARVGLCSTIYCGNLYTQKSGPFSDRPHNHYCGVGYGHAHRHRVRCVGPPWGPPIIRPTPVHEYMYLVGLQPRSRRASRC